MTISRKENFNSTLFPCSILVLAAPIAILLSIAADESTLPSTSCDFDGDGCSNGFCYEFLPSVSDFPDARIQCMQKQDYNLLSLHSQEESEFVAQLLCSVNATFEVWTAGYARTLDKNALNTSFSWLVDDVKLIIMDWMSEFEPIDPTLYDHSATIVLSNKSGDSHYIKWVVVPPTQVYRHALCKRRINETNGPCLTSKIILNDGADNCTDNEKPTTASSSSTSFSIAPSLPPTATRESSPTTTNPTTKHHSNKFTTPFSSTTNMSSTMIPAVVTTPTSSTQSEDNTTDSSAPTTKKSSGTTMGSTPRTTTRSTPKTTSPSTSGSTSQSTPRTTSDSTPMFPNHFLSGATKHLDPPPTTTSTTANETTETTSTVTDETTETTTSSTDETTETTSTVIDEPTETTTSTVTDETTETTSNVTNETTETTTSSTDETTETTSTVTDETSETTSTVTDETTETTSTVTDETTETTSTVTDETTETTTSTVTDETTLTTSTEQSSTGGWCSATSFGGCDWPATQAGTMANTSCPANSTGSASWYCDPETLVFEPEDTPDFSQCVNDWVNAIEKEILLGHKSSLELAESLWGNASVTQLFYSKDLSQLQNIMLEIDRKFINETDLYVSANYTEQTRTYSEYLVYTCDVLLNSNQSIAWDQLNEERSQVANQLSINVENVGFILASALDDQQDDIQRDNLAVFVERRPKQTYADQGFQFEISEESSGQWQGITISLPNGFQENSPGNLTSVVTIMYSNMQTYFGDNYIDPGLTAEVITNVIGLSIGLRGQSVYFENDGIEFRIPHSIPDDTHYHICSFWNSTRSTSGLWDSSGCTLLSQDSQYTTCTCNHLTDFAILLDINGVIETISPLAQEILNLLTIVCGSLSAVCLTICLITFYSLRILRCIRTSVTKNLCICLLIEDILMLTMMEETSNKVVCGIIAGTLEYFLLAAFMWMLIEGIHLYRLLILVFETSSRTMRLYYLIGYGVPFVIVTLSACIYPQGYGTSLYCWLDDKLIWSFAVPVAIIILINFAMLILALRTASQVKVRRPQNKLAQFRKYVTGSISLTSILGLTWVFGFFYINQSTVVFAYIFTVLSASQGIFIFIFHCIINENVRKYILRHLARCKKSKIPAKYKPDDQKQLKTPQDAKEDLEKVDYGVAVWTLSNSVTKMTSIGSTNGQGTSVQTTISTRTSWNKYST